MSPVSPELLKLPRTAISATRLVCELGELADYMLNGETLDAANRHLVKRPPLPAEVGCCWAVIGVRDSNYLQFLLPAFVLPLRWQASSEHDQRLPPAIHEVADQMLKAKDNSLSGKYSIHFHNPNHTWPDLREFDRKEMDAPSAFASLAAGLSSLQQEIHPNPQVWASATWDGEFKPVELLEQKFAAAKLWGASTFYVAESQSDINQFRSPELEIRTLGKQNQPGPEHAMSEYFADSFLEPTSEDWEPCQKYHAAVRSLNGDKADQFYRDRLFQLIVHRLGQNIWMSPSIDRQLDVTHLVTIATQHVEPVKTIVASLGVKHLLVLYTTGPSDLQSKADEVRVECKKAVPDLVVKIAGFPYNPNSEEFPRDFADSMADHIASFVQGVPESNVAFDIDRGLTLHKVALTQRIIQTENLVVSLYHEIRFKNWVEHGTERLFVFPRNENWSLAFMKFAL